MKKQVPRKQLLWVTQDLSNIAVKKFIFNEVVGIQSSTYIKGNPSSELFKNFVCRLNIYFAENLSIAASDQKFIYYWIHKFSKQFSAFYRFGPNFSLFEAKLLLYITKSVCRPPFISFTLLPLLHAQKQVKALHLSFWLDLLNKSSLYVLYQHRLLNLICYIY